MSSVDMKHLKFLDHVAAQDVAHVKMREATYRGSWKKRGGIGAFMMLARKWDRIENLMENKFVYDIFDGIYASKTGEDGGILAEVRDLRQYLLLVESEMVARGIVLLEGIEFPRELADGDTLFTPGTPEDGGQHGVSNGQG